MSRCALLPLSLPLALLVAACGGGGSGPGDPTDVLVVRDVPPDSAVRVFQVDFLHPQGDHLDSSWGRLRIDPGVLASTTGIQRGFLNVAMGDRWVAVNVPVLAPSEGPYAVYFDLGLAQQTKLSSVALYVKHSNQGLGGFADHRGQEAVHAVERWPFNAEQFTPVPDPGGPPTAMLVTDSLLPPHEVTIVSQMITNVQCARNQCMTMAAANALGYLEDMGQITLPHDHVLGEFGDDTLVGQLDDHSGRGGTSRTVGDGLSVTSMVDGTFAYLDGEGLTTALDFRHQNDGEAWTILGTGSGAHTAHSITSWDDGSAISHGWIYDRIAAGAGVVLVYRRDSGGGHAGRLTLAGFDDTGRLWIRFTHDVLQTDRDPTDTAGLEDWLADWGDTDGDGTPNFLTDSREIRFVWAHIP